MSNQLSGSLPEMSNNFTNLVELRLGNNTFTGTIPASYEGSNVKILYLN